MFCLDCDVQILSEEDICFYYKSENSVHLIAKYEKMIILEEKLRFGETSSKGVRITCLECGSQIGKKCPFGHRNSNACFFAHDKVTIFHGALKTGEKWQHVYKQTPFNKICSRNSKNYFGYYHLPGETAENVNLEVDRVEPGEIVFPDPKDTSQFMYDDILMSDRLPYDYQITAYIEALQRDLILVLPTGYGKTLIASIVAARLKRLNEEYMVLFIVDRIPLVFQQAEAISVDTQLKVCALTGENSNHRIRRRLQRRDFDVLVSTAGAYLECKLEIHVFCCVIIDECHHATKRHDYVRILDLVKECNLRSRVLGLTASPPSNKKSKDSTNKLLVEFRSNFFNAPIFHNLSVKSQVRGDATVRLEIITHINDPALTAYQGILEKEFYRLANIVNESVGGKVVRREDWENPTNRSNLIRVLKCLNSSSCTNETFYEPIKSMKRIYQVLENTELLGVTYANETLKDMEFYQDLNPHTNYSPRVRFLLDILNGLPDSSKIIIFVLTRKIAHLLVTILKSIPQVNDRFSPLKLVGQSGLLGMSWQDEQELALNRFRQGGCDLLVSTSVLEEGQDISCCNIVIRFDGIKSLISFKQSQGRARKWENSQFILILSQKERELYEEIKEQESLVKEVLNEHHVDSQVPSLATLQIQENVMSRSSLSGPREFAIQSSECVVELYLGGVCELWDIQDAIALFFRENYFLFLTHIDMAHSSTKWKSRGIFPSEDSLLNLGLQTQSRNAYQRYKQLSVEWSFCLEGVSQSIWTRTEIFHKEESITTKWPIREIVWGRFENKSTFILSNRLECTEQALFEYLYERSIYIHLDGMIIEIPLTSIRRFLLADWSESSVMLYMPLSHAPVVCSPNRGAGNARFTRDTHKRVEYFGESPVVGLSIPYGKNNWSQLWVFLHTSTVLPVPLFESRVIIAPACDVPTYAEDNMLTSSDELIQDCVWLFSMLEANRNICLTNSAVELVYRQLSQCTELHILKGALSKMVSVTSDVKTNYFFDFEKSFTEHLSMPLTPTRLPPNYRFIECAMVTPSRVVPLHPVLTQCSRLYRRYPRERFLNLAFREEDQGELKDKRAMERIRNILENGLSVSRANFYFLVCSSSQLRTKRAIFLQAPDQESAAVKIEEMRLRLIGRFVIRNETKFLSRLGLFCTSDYPTLEVAEGETYSLPDIRAEDSLLLTDGAGKIRRALAQLVLSYLKNYSNSPTLDTVSAMQIRLAGLKGVLTIVDGDKDLDFRDLQHCNVLYRESMEKLEWTDAECTLCVVKVAQYNRLSLNIQMLNLLTSLEDSTEEWDPKPRLRALFSQQLERFARVFTDHKIAQQELVKNLPNYFEETNLYFDILREPFFQKLLQCVYTYNIKNLIEKFHIPIESGCLLMGIPDPIGVLIDGEVFITFQEDEREENTVWEGRVLTYKNPCLHPGDLLTPTAVNKTELHHLRNVIVFPVIASTSMSACSAGGDLDGDEFAIIWDLGLIPPQSAVFPPLNYDSLLEAHKPKPAEATSNVLLQNAPKRAEKSDVLLQNDPKPAEATSDVLLQNDPDIQRKLADAYCRVITNESLGIIAHYHLSICDQMVAGARDPLSIQLAKAASLAVDSPKTGVSPIIPDEAKRLINQNGYPDFMEKRESTSYRSSKLLGELYHAAREVCYEAPEWVSILNHPDAHLPGSIVPSLQVPGYLQFMDETAARYRDYSAALQRLMLAFGVETEAEVVTSLVIKCHPLLTADRGKVATSLSAATACLVQEFREIFHHDTSDADYLKKAAAWYITVHQKQDQHQRGELVCHSFAWIVPEYLCQILQRKNSRTTRDIYSVIGASAKEYILTQRESIRAFVESKLCALPIVKSAINEQLTRMYPTKEVSEIDKMFDVTAFGSTSVYLCELQSDLDISVTLTSFGRDAISDSGEFRAMTVARQQRHLISNYLSPVIGRIADQRVEKLGSEVPVISFTLDSPHEGCSQVCIDITVDSDGVLKSQHIMDLYRRTGGVFFGWLWVLVHWARHVGILKCQNSPDSTGIILTAQFEALVLSIYNQMEERSETASCLDSDCSLDSLINSLMEPSSYHMLGLMLGEFFWRGYKVTSGAEQDIEYTWPIEGEPTHTIYTPALDRISVLLFQAWHCLMFTRDVRKLFERVHTQSSINRRFSPRISDRIKTSTEFYRKMLSSSTGATIKIKNMGSNILLTGYGSPTVLRKLSAEILLLEKNTALTKRYKSNFNRYMMDGCALMVMANSSPDCRVDLHPFTHGCFKDFHSINEKSIVQLTNKEVNTNWKVEGIGSIQSLFWNQVSSFPANNTIGALQLKTRFGFFYVLDGVEALQYVGDSLSLEEFQSSLQRNLKYRKELTCGIEDLSMTNNPPPLSEAAESPQQNAPQKVNSTPVLPKLSEAKRLSCAFCPGIQRTKDSDQIHEAVSVFESALRKCGFQEKREHRTYTWRVDLQVSSSREVRINLDENLEVISITERPLIWLLATIIGDRRNRDLNRIHDLRIRAESAKSLKMDSNLCQSIFQQGAASDLFSISEDGSPMPSKYIKHRFKIIKHNTKATFYENEDTIAKISFGSEYCRDNINFRQQYCELTIYHSEEELRGAVESEKCCSQLQAIVAKALDVSLRVSENISS